MLKKVMRKEGGFTLLELLIVIVIIGILALLIIPNVTSAPKKARDTQRKTDLRAVQKGLEEYYTSYSVYPVEATATSVSTALTAPLGAAANGGTAIMATVPTDPNHNATTPYKYTSTDGTNYKLSGCLENGGDNGTDTQAGSGYDGTCSTRAFVLQSNN